MHLRSTIEPTLAIDPARRTVTAVITTPTPDRGGDIVTPTGLKNADEFLLNPVVLWAHQRAMPPIGTCVALDVQPQRVIAITKFAAGVPLADDVFRLYEQGILRGWSIGILPRRTAPRPGRRGVRIDEWDLIEYSAVPVPENPEALTLALEKGFITDRRLKRFITRMNDDAFAPLLT